MLSEAKPSQYEIMTKTSIPKLIIRLSIPTILSMLVTNIYNMADTAFVGQLGNSASGAVGVVFGFMAILQAVGFMFGQGSGSIVARLLGARDKDKAGTIASTGFFCAMLLGFVIEILGFLFLDPLVMALGSTETIAPFAKTYISFILLAAPFMTTSFVMNNILRYEGKASLGMIGLMTGGILNMIGDPIFMFAFDMGIAGAGLSTAISQFVSFCVLLSMFLSGKTQSKLSVRKITREFNVLFDIVATGFPSLVRQGLQAVSTMILNQQARIYGDAAVAAMSIVSRISFFIFAVGLGIGQGFQPVCGFNYGARKFSRVKEAFSFTLVAGEVLLGIFAVAGLLFSNQAIAVFRDDAEVIAFGTPALRYQCMALFLNPLIVLSNMTLQSTGQRAWATFLSMMRSGLYLIPMIYILTYTMGARGIQLAQPVSDVLSFATALPVIVNFIRKLPEDERETVCIDKV